MDNNVPFMINFLRAFLVDEEYYLKYAAYIYNLYAEEYGRDWNFQIFGDYDRGHSHYNTILNYVNFNYLSVRQNIYDPVSFWL